MYVIGLTGNIASGKSTVAAMLGQLGALVIDADKLAHQAMVPGTAVYHRVVERFGVAILAKDGAIDRGKLGAIVFRDAAALADLEGIVHPAVIADTLQRLEQAREALGVVEAVKLLEAGMQRYCNAVWVVATSYEEQIRRLMETRGFSRAEAELRIAAQPAVELKLAHADVVIDNSHDLQTTWQQVIRAWNAIPGVAPVAEETPWPFKASQSEAQ